jgi:hypothetical protein
VAAQFFRLMIDLAHSSRGTYEILKVRSGGVCVPPSPNGVYAEAMKRFASRIIFLTQAID